MTTAGKGKVRCPSGQSAEFRREWTRLAEGLDSLGISTASLRPVMETYVWTWLMFREAAKHLDLEGSVVESKRGGGRVSPWFRVHMETSAALLRLARQLGLTPASRARLNLPVTRPLDLIDRLKIARRDGGC